VRKTFTYLFLAFLIHVKCQNLNLLPDTILLCTGDTASLEIRPDPSHTGIRWQTPEGVVNNTRTVRAHREGKYFITIHSSQGFSISDSTQLRVLPRPRRMMNDTVLCRARQTLRLDAGNAGMRYTWNNGQNSQQITITSPGKYWSRVSNGKCARTDTVRVTIWPVVIPVVPSETVFCLSDENKMLVARTGGWPVTWGSGASSPTFAVSREGTYSFKMKHPVCGSLSDSVKVKFKACDCEMLIPNSFTPNEDNRNDYFFPVVQCEYSYFNLTVSDRWGNTVYVSNSSTGKWDGRFKGNLCPEDVYIYRIESTEKGSDRKNVRSGQIALFR
jgi:gliding motility-associated-like protein